MSAGPVGRLHSAHWLAGTFTDLGFPRVEIWTTGDSPAVFADWIPDPAAPTVLSTAITTCAR